MLTSQLDGVPTNILGVEGGGGGGGGGRWLVGVAYDELTTHRAFEEMK